MNFKRPTAIIWKERAVKNIQKMKNKADISGTALRPHFKTHQNLEIASWFKEQELSKITVSSVEMAKFFADNGWQDITIAFPVNLREIDDINLINSKIEALHLLVESEESITFLEDNLNSKIKLWIKVDIGYKRTGIDYTNKNKIIELVQKILKSEKLDFEGLLTHAGHAYGKSLEQKQLIHHESLKRLQAIKQELDNIGISSKISSGDTPSCSVAKDFKGFDEMRPGNFVLYDVGQFQMGNCTEEEISIAIACPVVAKHEERKEIVIYGGGVHFSKDSLPYPHGERSFYGYLVEHNPNGTWNTINPRNYLKSISQEHGVLRVIEETFSTINIGDLVYVLPVHSCMAMDLLKNYVQFLNT